MHLRTKYYEYFQSLSLSHFSFVLGKHHIFVFVSFARLVHFAISLGHYKICVGLVHYAFYSMSLEAFHDRIILSSICLDNVDFVLRKPFLEGVAIMAAWHHNPHLCPPTNEFPLSELIGIRWFLLWLSLVIWHSICVIGRFKAVMTDQGRGAPYIAIFNDLDGFRI